MALFKEGLTQLANQFSPRLSMNATLAYFTQTKQYCNFVKNGGKTSQTLILTIGSISSIKNRSEEKW